jgi:crotonobetainyl-CoA:carnitine CoA-transferase CaiB-like acyl-CoA transferase
MKASVTGLKQIACAGKKSENGVSTTVLAAKLGNSYRRPLRVGIWWQFLVARRWRSRFLISVGSEHPQRHRRLLCQLADIKAKETWYMDPLLKGYVVLDLSQVIAGPETGMLLGELGADVIKIEKPAGEDARFMGADPSGEGITRTFSVLNRNKRSIVLDLTTDDGKQVFYRLVKQADMVIEGFVPGTAERMGIGYEQLAAMNPRLIYASISGYGRKGPSAQMRAYDLAIQGLSGVMAARRYPDGTPVPAPVWIGDASLPFMLAFGILCAILARMDSGVGQKVEGSLLHAQLAMQATQLVKVEGEEQREDGTTATFFPYLCSDDEYINITILNERQWRDFCNAMGMEHLADDPEYASIGKRAAHRDELYGLIGGILGTRPSGEWLDVLQRAGVPCGPVIDRQAVFSLPEVTENGMMLVREQPGLGLVNEVSFPIQFSSIPVSVQRPAPFAGEHTQELLAEHGFTADDIQELLSKGIVKQHSK